MAGGATARPISLFFSYSHKDEVLRDKLGDHLVPLERAGLIEVWHDREMLPGDSVDEEIAEKLKTADVILVLVSPSFIRSSYCWDIEFENAIERHKQGEARVVPVILRPCQWQVTRTCWRCRPTARRLRSGRTTMPHSTTSQTASGGWQRPFSRRVLSLQHRQMPAPSPR